MPTQFACPSCLLQFSVGWLHYHEFDSGYGSRTLLVCSSCGTQHAIEIALRNRGPEFFTYRDVRLASVTDSNRVLALRLIRKSLQCSPALAKQHVGNLPVTLKKRLSNYDLDHWRELHAEPRLDLEFPVVDREPNPSFGPIQTDRLLGASKAQVGTQPPELSIVSITEPLTKDSMINVEIQCCYGCSSVGTLSPEFEVTQPCPQCRELGLTIVSSYVT